MYAEEKNIENYLGSGVYPYDHFIARARNCARVFLLNGADQRRHGQSMDRVDAQRGA